MSQETERYQLENNGNTYLVRTPAGSGGADVEANPEGEATEDLEKLKVGETIYGIPAGYDVHTYQYNKTYTSSDTNYQQLLDDLTAGHDIKLGNNYYRLVNYLNNQWHYSCFAFTNVNDYFSNAFVSIEKSGDSIIIYNINTRSLTSVNPNMSAGNYPLVPTLTIAGVNYSLVSRQIAFSTTAPTADNTSGYLDIRILNSEPATRYNGYLYIITA